MNGSSFIDTNIFVCRSGSPGTPKRAGAARFTRSLVIAVCEFSPSFSNEAARVQIDGIFNSLQIVPSSLPLCLEAGNVRERYQLSWWDSLIVAAATEAKRSVLCTEDTQHGAAIRGVKIVNPFLTI